MSTESLASLNRKKSTRTISTRLAAGAGMVAAAFSSAGCTTTTPGIDEYSHCGDNITNVAIYDGAVIRSEPRTDNGIDDTKTKIIEIDFVDGDRYDIKQQLNVFSDLGRGCIRIANGYAGDRNGSWYGMPKEAVAPILKDEGEKNAVIADPDGYVWVNTAQADI